MKIFKIKLCNSVFLLFIISMVMACCNSVNDSSSTPSAETLTTLLKFSINDLDGIDNTQWSEVREIDGKNIRLVLSDEAIFTLPVWWKKSPRPDKGEIFILEIDYKDVLSHPFIVSSFGNCGFSVNADWLGQENPEIQKNGLSELHRIAGKNTSTWKTASVPVSWDYLYAGPGNPKGIGKQEFSIKLSPQDKNLPISEFRIRKAKKEDEMRYNAETRAWIREKQEKYYGKINNLPLTKIPDKWNSKDCVPYLSNYLSPIMPFDIPKTSEIDMPMEVRMSMNEIECKQIGVYANRKDLEKVSISLSDLRNDEGVLFAPKISLFTVEYAFVTAGNSKKQSIPKLDPQRIWPLYETSINTGHSQAFWVKFETSAETAKPGLYKGEINILSKGKIIAKMPLEIEVLPITLLNMDEAELSMGGCVTGFIPFHNIQYAVKNNVNATNLWFASVRPEMTNVNGKMVLDFTLMDEWMKEAKRSSLKNIVYFLGGNPYGFPVTMNLERELFILMQNSGTIEERANKFFKLAVDKSNRGKILEEIRDYYSQWIREVTQHAQENDWPELILTPFDEPAKHRQEPYRKPGHENDDRIIGTGPWIKGHFEDGCDLIRKAAPSTRIYGSIHHPSGIEFLPDVNVFCTNAIHLDPELGDKVRAGGKDKYFWQYTGVGAGSEPAHMRYSYGFYFGAFDSRGSLLWAYNWGNRFDTTEGNNWMICWDTPFSTIPTLSYEGLREAWDDRRYIETLKKKAKSKGLEKEVRLFLDTIFKEAVRDKTQGGEDTVDDFWNETSNLEKLDEWRYSIANKIIEISK